VWADEEMIRRVLINLLDNALKFTPANGRIHVHLQPEPQLTVEHEPGLRCLIQDSGPGIPAEHRQQVFNRFMRTNIGGAQVRGTGLGLAFCHMAIEAHDGRIWVESADEGGSLFIFTLPGVPILTEEIG
jgi:signal transduction histidine kinase